MLFEKNTPDILEEIPLSHYLLGFMEFYGFIFNFRTHEINLTQKDQITKKENPDFKFNVYYKQKEIINLAASAFNIREAFSCLRNRFRFVSQYNFTSNESILKYLVNPRFREFKKYYVDV
jgi:hypothetical protein